MCDVPRLRGETGGEELYTPPMSPFFFRKITHFFRKITHFFRKITHFFRKITHFFEKIT